MGSAAGAPAIPTRTVTTYESAPLAGAKVDRAAGVIYGVLACGHVSDNGRDYGWGTELKNEDVAALYGGVRSMCDHGAGSEVDRCVGWHENPRRDAEGRPRTDFHVLKSHPMAERVFEAAERNDRLFGFSHVAVCRTSQGANGRERIEGIQSVESLDLVLRPATTKGFFESHHKGRGVSKTIRQVIGEAAPRMSVKQLHMARLLEDLGVSMDAPAADVPADGADPDEAISAAFRAAMHAQVDAFVDGGLDWKALCDKLKALAKAHGDVTDDKEGGEPPDDTPADPDKAESRKRLAAADALLEGVKACEAGGFAGATVAEFRMVGAVDAADRAALVARLKGGAGGEKPKSGVRQESRGAPAPTGQAAPVPGAVPAWID